MRITLAGIFLALPVALFLSLTLSDAAGPGNTARVPQVAELAFGAITATGAAGANTVMTLTNHCYIASFENTTNVELQVTLDAVKKKRVPASSSRVFDLGANDLRWSSGTVIGVFGASSGALPTSGNFEASCN